MPKELAFPDNIPLQELYLVRSPEPVMPQVNKASEELLNRYAREEKILRDKVRELKERLESLQRQKGVSVTVTGDAPVFVSVQEKILAADGSALQDYLP